MRLALRPQSLGHCVFYIYLHFLIFNCHFVLVFFKRETTFVISSVVNFVLLFLAFYLWALSTYCRYLGFSNIFHFSKWFIIFLLLNYDIFKIFIFLFLGSSSFSFFFYCLSSGILHVSATFVVQASRRAMFWSRLCVSLFVTVASLSFDSSFV